jgi:hypothetical protein
MPRPYTVPGFGYQLKEFELYSRLIGVPPGEPAGSYGFMSPEEVRRRLDEALPDIVPSRWEAAPAWRLVPSGKELAVPQVVPPGQGPKLQR